MAATSRLGGGSLALRLAAIALVPMVAVGALSLERIHREEDVAHQADQLIRDIELEQDVSAIYAPANLERIAIGGLAAIDQIGYERSIVTQFTGVDFEQTYNANKTALDNALSHLRHDHPDVVLADGTRLDVAVGYIHEQVNEQRDLLERLAAAPEEVEAVFENLDALLENAVEPGQQVATDTSSPVNAPQLDALANVLRSAGEMSQTVIGGLVDDSQSNSLAIVAATAVHETYLTEFESLLDDEQAKDLLGVRTILLPPPPSLLTGTATDPGNRSIPGPEAIAEKASAVLNQLDYLSGLEGYSATFHEHLLTEAHAEAQLASANVTETKWLIASIAAIALLLTALVLASTAIPLLRLSRRATKISNGEIDPKPLRVRGPRVIRRLTSAMNDMLVTLHGIDTQIARMSAGNLDPSHDADLPGAIGISMRHSVERLSAVTEQLHRSEQLASAIVEQASNAIWTIDEDTNIMLANESSELLTGVAESSQQGLPISTYLDTVDGETFIRAIGGARSKVLVSSSAITTDGNGAGRITTVIAHDISERSHFEAQLAHQARHDLLTGLPNRFSAMEHLEDLLARSTPFALLFIDIDGFKSVNDTQGHEAGDAVLTEIASRLSRSVRSTEFVARLGGDEFIVVQTSFDHLDDAIALGQRIIEEIELPYDSDRGIFALSASVGVARSEPDMNALKALRQADSALYLAKQRGRGRVEQFDAALQASIHHEADLALALRHGVRNQELELHLQPIMSLTTGDMDCAEALVRWNRPGVGCISPGEFIPIAERSSVIFDIERWVLLQVCDRIAAWRHRDPSCSVRVAVNISGRHLIEGDLIGDLDIALGVTGADPTMLEFELTETHLLEDLDTATEVLNTLRSRGITIAVDDFGTGYSSMTYLRHLPVDVLKIDRTFIARATENGYDSTIIEAVLTIARSLDLDVVAEGIETVEQLEYVRARGCNRAQGFLLARPMPVPDAEAVLFSSQAAEWPAPGITTTMVGHEFAGAGG